VSRLDPTIDRAVLARLGFAGHDLATRDKIPLIRRFMAAEGDGLALDIGIGTGYTTYSVFGGRPAVCVDVYAPNLQDYRERVAAVTGARRPLCAVAQATALPFKSGAFRFILCSEVLEHLENDDAAVRELSRVLGTEGRAVITVPYAGLGFTTFLELCGIKTVHDFPGPEHHVRPGYDERSLGRLLGRHGLAIERHVYYFRFFTRLLADGVGLAHLLYQRAVHRRRAWTWSEAAASEGSWAFGLYRCVFPALWAVSRVDRLLWRMRGFGLIAAVTHQTEARADAPPRVPPPRLP